tara:strand:- start:1569 stop:2003 length:435 start_codon:yes stop_codon:yes gene_type:complete
MSRNKVFEKGCLYALKGLAKNKQYIGMMNYNGVLYLTDGKGYAGNRPTFYDGDLFVALDDIHAFDREEARREAAERIGNGSRHGFADEASEERWLDSQAARSQRNWARSTNIRLLAPDGNIVSMMLKGNMGKFKKVTKRTRKVK